MNGQVIGWSSIPTRPRLRAGNRSGNSGVVAIDTDLVRIRRCLEDDGLDRGLRGPDGGQRP